MIFLYSFDSSADREGGREAGRGREQGWGWLVHASVFRVVPDLGLSCKTGFIFWPSA